jgi:predicted amidohydrolase YtcJ
VHPTIGGWALLTCDLHDLAWDREAYLARIRAYAAAHPDEAWIIGGGWAMPAFPGGTPSRADLDAAVPGRPVFLENRDGHGAWVSSRALELAGVDAATSDPADGRIEREADGSPQGTLHEGAAELVRRLVPPFTAARWEEAILAAQAYLHGFGITAITDAWVAAEHLPAYRALAERGDLTLRTALSLWWDRAGGLEQLAWFEEARRSATIGRLRASTVKLMLDGVLENFTGALLEPYLDATGGVTAAAGTDFIEPARLAREIAPALDAAGFQLHFHAIGDRAVRSALDAVAAVRRANGPRDRRPHVAHLQVVHPADIPRFAALGVGATIQPLWAAYDSQMRDLTIPFLGPERSGWQYPFRSLERAGARLVGGSDWSVSTPNVLAQVEVAVNRVVPESRGIAPPFLPDERLDLASALRAFTIGAAWANGLEHATGTLEPGRLADLVVLDRDVFDRGAGEIGDARVLLTLSQGIAVHADPTLGW